jgi:hypothetical protein
MADVEKLDESGGLGITEWISNIYLKKGGKK